MKRKSARAVAAGTLLLAAAAPAMAINVGGIEIPLGSLFTAGQIYSTTPTQVGQTLESYGKVDSINSTPVSDLCSNCELTFRSTEYQVAAISPTSVSTTGGVIRFYLGTGATKDFSTTNAGGLAGDITEATNGTLWLTLRGHATNASNHTFTTSLNTSTGGAFGTGLADVDTTAGSGTAASFFNSNMIAAPVGGNADVQLNSSWSSVNRLYPGQGACGADGCLRGSADFHAVAVPEPETYALMLSALGLIGYVVHRRRKV